MTTNDTTLDLSVFGNSIRRVNDGSAIIDMSSSTDQLRLMDLIDALRNKGNAADLGHLAYKLIDVCARAIDAKEAAEMSRKQTEIAARGLENLNVVLADIGTTKVE